jgi:hypothetical protein
MSDPLDDFLAELRAGGHADEALASAVQALRLSDDAGDIEEYDRLVGFARQVASRKLPLLKERWNAFMCLLPSTRLDRFIDELHAAITGNPPELEKLEAMLHALRLDDSPHGIEDFDRMMEIAGRELPLIERVQAIIAAMEGRQQ